MNVKADVSKDVKAAFLFGAGVEVDYGFPLGGELAVKLLSSDEIDKNAKDMVAQMLNLNSISNKKYFSRTDLKKLEKSMINNRQEEIKNYFAGFDKRIQNIFSEYEVDTNKSISIDNISFSMEIFNSKSDSNNKIRDIENFFYQIIFGVFGTSWLKNNQKEFFKNMKISDPFSEDLFSFNFNIISIFNSDTQKLLKEIKGLTRKNENKSEEEKFLQLFKDLFEIAIDYQDLMQNMYSALLDSSEYKEKEFIKIALILFKLRELIKECYDKRNLSAESYYLDLKKDKLLSEAVIATTNYTNLISEVTGKSVYFLNGNIDNAFIIPDSEIKKFNNFDDIDKRKKHIPYIFTQTTLKPLFCVDMMEPFVQFSQEINKDCSILCVLGYAGNKDDVIVNSIIRKFLKKGKKVLYFAYSADLKNKELTDYIEKERKRITDLYGESENLKVVPIDGKRMIWSGNESISWLDYIETNFGGIR